MRQLVRAVPVATSRCSACGGARLRPEALRGAGRRAHASPSSPRCTIDETRAFLRALDARAPSAQHRRRGARRRSARGSASCSTSGSATSRSTAPGPTLSGGESQRIRLASQIGSELTGVIYVLDEPSIGLHQRDNGRLLATLERLRDLGNTVVVVEHDEETIEAADWVRRLRPRRRRARRRDRRRGHARAGRGARSSPHRRVPLAARCAIEMPRRARAQATGKQARDRGRAREQPEGRRRRRSRSARSIAVTGVSGAGKRTLVNEILYPALRARAPRRAATSRRRRTTRSRGLEHLDKVIDIDQTPIGRTPRSNPATYTKVFDDDPRASSRSCPRRARTATRPGASPST